MASSPASTSRSAGQQLAHRLLDGASSPARHHLQQARVAGVQRSQLSLEVAGSLFRRPDVRQDQAPEILVPSTLIPEADRRDAETFLHDLPGQRHRARRHAPHIAVVCSGRYEAQEVRNRSFVEGGGHGRGRRLRIDSGGSAVAREVRDVDGREQGDIGQVCAPLKRVVHHGHVAGPESAEGLESGRDAHRHRPQVHRHVVAQSDRRTSGVEEGAGVVPSLLDIRGIGGAAQGRPHLLGQGGEQMTEDLEGHGVPGR